MFPQDPAISELVEAGYIFVLPDRDQYGRRGKALELEETVSLTSTSASPPHQDYEDYLDPQANTDIRKRDLDLLGRQSQKYSWAAF